MKILKIMSLKWKTTNNSFHVCSYTFLQKTPKRSAHFKHKPENFNQKKKCQNSSSHKNIENDDYSHIIQVQIIK